jgi:hypothetical protein
VTSFQVPGGKRPNVGPTDTKGLRPTSTRPATEPKTPPTGQAGTSKPPAK